MVPAGTAASVVVIRGGYPVCVGDSLAADQRQSTTRPQAIDLGGRLAVPGLIDCRNHIVLMGNRQGHHTPCFHHRRAGTVRGPGLPAGAAGFITTIGGLSPNQFRGRLPTLAETGAAVPHHPAYLPGWFAVPR